MLVCSLKDFCTARSSLKIADLQLSAYDLIGFLLPGAIVLAEIGLALYGPAEFWHRATSTSTYGAVLLGMAAFGLGHLVNQASYQASILSARLLKTFRIKPYQDMDPKRVMQQARDRYWQDERQRGLVVNALNKACGCDAVENKDGARLCDQAYDLSLELIGNTFVKRDVFVLISDLSQQLWLLSLTALLPLAVLYSRAGTAAPAVPYLLGAVACLLCAWLGWRRSLTYQELADVTAFDILLAVSALDPKVVKAKAKDDGD
jgi:hypothetical protein